MFLERMGYMSTHCPCCEASVIIKEDELEQFGFICPSCGYNEGEDENVYEDYGTEINC